MTGDDSILDVGCGNNKRHPDAVGMDIREYEDVDVVHDVNETPWPFDDDRFERVLAYSVLEHVPDLPAVLGEIHRISKPGALLEGKVPHWKDRNAYIDPTHVGRVLGRLPDGTETTFPWPLSELVDSYYGGFEPRATLVCGFDERTFDFWDSTTEMGQRGYFEEEFRVRDADRIRRVRFWESRPVEFTLEVRK